MAHAISIAMLMVVVVVACLLRDVEMFDSENSPSASLPIGARDSPLPEESGGYTRALRPVAHNSYGIPESTIRESVSQSLAPAPN